MAEVAQGLSSPCCGTFSTVAGAIKDEKLLGSCGRCGTGFTAPNPSHVPEKYFSASIKNADGSVGTIIVKGSDFDVTCAGLVMVPGDVSELPTAPVPEEPPTAQPEPVVEPVEEPPAEESDGE